jgi:hypothetical protein
MSCASNTCHGNDIFIDRIQYRILYPFQNYLMFFLIVTRTKASTSFLCSKYFLWSNCLY